MSFALLYWILMLLWLLFGLYTTWPRSGPPGASPMQPLAGTLLLFVLFVLLGWKSFGAPFHP